LSAARHDSSVASAARASSGMVAVKNIVQYLMYCSVI
jgi:hypothetical protein